MNDGTAASRVADSMPRSVCPDCPPRLGGESSDFGGTPHTCSAFEERGAIGAARSLELGFDLAELERRLEREVDAPLYWRLNDRVDGGGRVTGFDAETRVELRARLVDYTHVSLDGDRCEGNACYDPAYGEWTCSDRLEVGVEADVETADGAVSARVEGNVFQGRPGFPFSEVPAGTLRANLRDVTGTLEVAPPLSLPIGWAALLVDIRFGADQTEGDVRPFIYFEDGECCGRDYSPLSGGWPDDPAELARNAGPLREEPDPL